MLLIAVGLTASACHHHRAVYVAPGPAVVAARPAVVVARPVVVAPRPYRRGVVVIR
jgi:hypothetical protein